MSCPGCGAEVQAGARFCWSCGQPVGVAGVDERRVVTVLFGDVVGFTSLAEDRDPEVVKNIIDTCFARIATDIHSFGGQVDKIIGDAVVALFGAPVAHEDDAERAVRAALRMQQTVQAFAEESGVPIRMRIGVHTGEVLVGRFQADTDYTAMGDTVNIASRLQALAEPGTVLVGEPTYQATKGAVRYEPVGSLEIRGRGDTVAAWRALEPIGLPGSRRTRREVPLVGRDAELDLLVCALDRTVARRRAHLALLLGDAGVGKTRLAEAVAARAADQHGALVMHGRCVPYGEANVWGPLAGALRGALGLEADAHPTEAMVRKAIATQLDLAPNADEAHRMSDGLRFLLDLDSPLREIDPTRAQEEAGRAFRLFVHLASSRRPVLLWLSDLHWADDLVRAMVDALLERLPRLPLMVMATARHELLDVWTPKPGRHTTIQVTLDPLDREAAAELLSLLLPEEVPERVREELLDRADGNPFYLEELAATLRGAGEEPVPALPDNVRGLVAARLDSVSVEERTLLEDASVLGRTGSVRALATMAERLHGWDDIEPMLRSLDERDLLHVDPNTWSFRSNLVHDVAYGMLTKTERARRHAGVAMYLEDTGQTGSRLEAIANHYRRAAALVADIGPVEGVPDDVVDRAVDRIEEVVDRGLAGSLVSASQLLSAGIDLLGPDDPRRARLLLRRARVHTERLDLPRARADVEEALRIAGPSDEPLLALAQQRLGDIEQRSGNYERSARLLEDAAARLAALGDVRGAAESKRLRGMTAVFAGHFEEADAALRDALAGFEQAGDRLGAAWARQNLAWVAYLDGDLDGAEERISEAMAAFGELGDRGGIAWSRGLLAYLRMLQGRFDDARAFAREELAEARERGDRWGEGMLTMLLASIELWEGRPAVAARRASRSLTTFGEMGEPLGQSQAAGVLGRALVRDGRVDEGLKVLADARGYLEDSRIDSVTAAAAAAAVDIGDAVLARRLLDDLDAREAGYGGIGAADRMVAQALTALQEGDVATAFEVLRPVRDDPDGPASNPNAQAALALAAAAAGESDAVAAAVAWVQGSNRSTYADRVLAAIAEGLDAARRGDEPAFREAFRRATTILAGTDDRLGPVVVALAEAIGLERLGSATASQALAAASERLAALGVGAAGWYTAFRLAAGATQRAPTAGR